MPGPQRKARHRSAGQPGPHGRLWDRIQTEAAGQGAAGGRRLRSALGSGQWEKRGLREGPMFLLRASKELPRAGPAQGWSRPSVCSQVVLSLSSHHRRLTASFSGAVTYVLAVLTVFSLPSNLLGDDPVQGEAAPQRERTCLKLLFGNTTMTHQSNVCVYHSLNDTLTLATKDMNFQRSQRKWEDAKGCRQGMEVQRLGCGERPAAWGCSQRPPVREIPGSLGTSQALVGRGHKRMGLSTLQELGAASQADPCAGTWVEKRRVTPSKQSRGASCRRLRIS